MRPPKRPRVSNDDSVGDKSAGSFVPGRVIYKPSTNSSASIMLAPHIAEDVDILQRHIDQHKTSEGEDPQSYQTLSHDTRNPIVYLSVPRYRTGLRPELGPGKEQLEIIEQIMGPFKNEVLDLYFNHIHSHFPVLDEETCTLIRKGPNEKRPKNLMCVIYANGAARWRNSDTLKLHPRPDDYYVWNKAISAVLDDFLSPCFSTVSAAILDQIGRPSVSIVGNVTLCGRTVSLAQTFGLHRDPSKWEIPDHEKQTRMRLWWGVLITDRWASIAYGGPPHVVKGFYDVPMPTLDSLISAKSTNIHKYASTCFVHLCALTELLGDILTLVHHLKPDPDEFFRAVEQRKMDLAELESRLPEWLPLPDRPGSSNLWFCFLSMRLLLNRVALRAAVLIGDTNLERTRLVELDASSSAVLDLVLILGEHQFQDFWLPFATHLLVLAVMVSLRCTVESQSAGKRTASFARLQRVMTHIQHAYDNYDWDIATYCLERCAHAVTRISSLATRESQSSPEPTAIPNIPVSIDYAASGTSYDDSSFALSEYFDPNAFDLSWEALWDTPSGLNFTI